MRVAGRRWTVEEIFQSGKGLAGLDEHQIRRWTSWHRWVTLAMLAHAFLAVVRADEHARHPRPDGLIPAYTAVEWYFPQHGESFNPKSYVNACTHTLAFGSP